MNYCILCAKASTLRRIGERDGIPSAENNRNDNIFRRLPLAPRGCIVQAWSIAETLRSWIDTAE